MPSLMLGADIGRDVYDEAYNCYRQAGEVLVPISHRLSARLELEP
ncbi:MAG: hypothetical protein ABSD85_03780 [Acidimicrobiales bacterium]